jgi:hypothetical protein
LDQWANHQHHHPLLIKHVRVSIRRARTVAEGLLNHVWARDISGELTVGVLGDYLRLWRAVQAVPHLGEEENNTFMWKWTASGQYTTKSAYRVLFHGKTALPGAAQVWNSFVPLKFKMHAWLVLHRRSWTADRRRRQGLQTHILRPLCGTHQETLDHLTLQCPLASAVWARGFRGCTCPTSCHPIVQILGSGGPCPSGGSLIPTGRRQIPSSCLSCARYG